MEHKITVKSINISNGGSTGVYYQFPGDTDFHLITNATTSVTAGRLDYKFANAASYSVLQSINKTGSTGIVLTYAPAVVLLEGKGKTLNDAAEVKDAVILTTVNGGTGSNIEMKITTPVMTADIQSNAALQSDPSVTVYGDRYGTTIIYDSDSQGLATIQYPQDQATAMVAAGADPKFSTSGTGGTYNAAVQIKNPVAKFDTEMSTSAINSDLILIGGPCASSLVATLLATESTTCSTDANGFLTKYPNGMIKEFENAFSSGHKALVVAGTNGAGTRAMAARVMQGTLSYQ